MPQDSSRVFLGHFITTREGMDFKTHYLFYVSLLTVLKLFSAKLQLPRDIKVIRVVRSKKKKEILEMPE